MTVSYNNSLCKVNSRPTHHAPFTTHHPPSTIRHPPPTELTNFTAYDNKLSGEIPPGLGEGCTKLKILSLHNNRLTGILPESLTLCTQLKQVSSVERSGALGHVAAFWGVLGRLGAF